MSSEYAIIVPRAGESRARRDKLPAYDLVTPAAPRDVLSTREDKKTAQAGDLALLLGRDRKTSVIQLEPGAEFHTHRVTVAHDYLLHSSWGTRVETHLGVPLTLLRPSTDDPVRNLERTTQVVYPRDAGYILMKLNITPGCHVIEAGTGSRGLTFVFAQAVHPTGHVTSYDYRADVQQLARENLRQLGLQEVVTFKCSDVSEGFNESDADALFLDVANPWNYIDQAQAALAGGGFFGSIVPTANQVINLIGALEGTDFCFVEAEELLLRLYKTVSTRLRPKDRLTPHTGYLVFGRKHLPLED